jgi:hypothetical protein
MALAPRVSLRKYFAERNRLHEKVEQIHSIYSRPSADGVLISPPNRHELLLGRNDLEHTLSESAKTGTVFKGMASLGFLLSGVSLVSGNLVSAVGFLNWATRFQGFSRQHASRIERTEELSTIMPDMPAIGSHGLPVKKVEGMDSNVLDPRGPPTAFERLVNRKDWDLVADQFGKSRAKTLFAGSAYFLLTGAAAQTGHPVAATFMGLEAGYRAMHAMDLSVPRRRAMALSRMLRPLASPKPVTIDHTCSA